MNLLFFLEALGIGREKALDIIAAVSEIGAYEARVGTAARWASAMPTLDRKLTQ